VFLICCGDQSRTQAMRRESTGQQGNTVHELLSDYGADGLRVMRFIPTEDLIEVRTWDPLKGVLCESTQIGKDRNQHQFTLSYEMCQYHHNENRILEVSAKRWRHENTCLA
jgi:hypothetical protein